MIQTDPLVFRLYHEKYDEFKKSYEFNRKIGLKLLENNAKHFLIFILRFILQINIHKKI